MGRVYVFADESGNFDFSRNAGASRYFSVGTIATDDPEAICSDLIRLRHRLAWDHPDKDTVFHATEDDWPTRNSVFEVLSKHDFRIDVTLLEKSKAQPQTRTSETVFYQYAWFYHLRTLVRRACRSGDELMVVASELGTKAKRKAFRTAVKSVVDQCTWRLPSRLAFWPTNSHPCLQAADYTLWAVMRKWEHGDSGPHSLVKDKVRSEYDLWAVGNKHYY